MIITKENNPLKDTRNRVSSVMGSVAPEKNNQDKHFKGQQAQEEVICFFRQHWIVLMLPIVSFTLTIFVVSTVVIAITFNSKFFIENSFLYKLVFFSMFLGMTFYSHHFFLRIINYFLNIVIITNQRLVDIKKTIYLHHDLDAIDLSQVQDVIKTQDGLIKNLLRYGNLKVTLAATATTKTLSYVPKADFHFRVINRCIQASRMGIKIRAHHGASIRKASDQKKFLDNIVKQIPEEERMS